MARRSYGKTINYESRAGYVSGSTVRKLSVAEQYSNEAAGIEKLEEERRRKRQQQKKIRRVNKLNFIYTVAVTGVAAVVFGLCYQYLNLQSEVKTDAAQISQLEMQLSTLTSQNDEAEAQAEADIDYDAIYDIAVNELGMIYPEKRQVIRYAAGESEYVKQYQDIPNAD